MLKHMYLIVVSPSCIYTTHTHTCMYVFTKRSSLNHLICVYPISFKLLPYLVTFLYSSHLVVVTITNACTLYRTIMVDYCWTLSVLLSCRSNVFAISFFVTTLLPWHRRCSHSHQTHSSINQLSKVWAARDALCAQEPACPLRNAMVALPPLFFCCSTCCCFHLLLVIWLLTLLRSKGCVCWLQFI